MKALVFPGQGSQFVGMGNVFFEKSARSKDIFDQADSILGYSLTNLMFNGPIETLTRTCFAQPALFTTSIAILKHYLENNKIEDVAQFVAGHSLGEYSALVAADVLTVEDALNLVKTRGELMENSNEGNGAMVAVLGIDFESLSSCLPSDNTCVIANDNAPGQIVISGSKDSCNIVIESALQKGAKRCINLPVSAAFHSPFMKRAQDKMEEAIDSVPFKDPKIPVLSNILAKPLKNAQEIKETLKKQICGPVRWRECILHLEGLGVAEIIEIGAGSVLTGLNKRIAPKIESTSYQNDFLKQ